ncbi:hypothetical protein BDV37DRAFT_261304 [Aspergillus pseudonomiae]|uniref:Uncharacterized protein n=1 Tax=Aspergillus pseudonomiae TaxID=1506151 RepID=A0A5N7CYL5_9EURO|nr:uncharacterized protein BDV37DRAFT_261304 [Aspergillus pseudonomiae]KAE8399241.1 hypothetical protein BDV37DRAFT_261304 [Aspergillus pseudonomiae]
MLQCEPWLDRRIYSKNRERTESISRVRMLQMRAATAQGYLIFPVLTLVVTITKLGQSRLLLVGNSDNPLIATADRLSRFL